MSVLVSDVLTYARQIAQTDSNGLTDAQGLLYANDALEYFIRDLIDRDIDAAQIQEAYTDLIVGTGSYAYPSDKFLLKTIEINTGSGTQQDFTQASKLDISNIQGTESFDWLRVNQDSQAPLFDDHGDTFEIFPTPTVGITGGLKIVYFLIPTEFASTSSVISYPASLDYRCLACKIVELYKKQLEKTESAVIFNQEYKERLGKIIRILAPESQQPIKPQALQMTGWNF